MNKQQIEALINATIAGQGSAVDIGGKLAVILHEILEMAAAGKNVQSNWNETDTESPQYIQNKPDVGYHVLKILTSENQAGLSDAQMLACLELDGGPVTDIQQLWNINPANTFVAPPDTVVPIAITAADIRPDDEWFHLYAYCNIDGEFIDFATIEYNGAGSGYTPGWNIKVSGGD